MFSALLEEWSYHTAWPRQNRQRKASKSFSHKTHHHQPWLVCNYQTAINMVTRLTTSNRCKHYCNHYDQPIRTSSNYQQTLPILNHCQPLQMSLDRIWTVGELLHWTSGGHITMPSLLKWCSTVESWIQTAHIAVGRLIFPMLQAIKSMHQAVKTQAMRRWPTKEPADECRSPKNCLVFT